MQVEHFIHVLSVGSSWTSGLYVANLTAQQSGKQSQIWFVVRDPSSQAELLFQSSFNTFVAYNNYGDGVRHSLYPYNSTAGRRAFKVSFDRPFGRSPPTSARQPPIDDALRAQHGALAGVARL